MKIIKENIENFEDAGDLTTVIDPVTAEAIDQDKKSMEAMKKASEDLKAEIDGAPKAEKPKKIQESASLRESADTRQATDEILELVNCGTLDANDVLLACLKYMSEDAVADMAQLNGFLDESLFEDHKALTEDAREEEVSYNTSSDKGFYVGDICYALYDEDYYNIWGDKYNYENGEIDINGYTVCVHGTMRGDGEYTGSDGNTYSVDAGVIGIVPLEVVDMNNSNIRHGRIIEGAGEATLDYYNGDGSFDIYLPKETITISTSDDDEWEDYDDYDDDYNDYNEDEEIEESLNEAEDAERVKAQELANLLGFNFIED